MVRFSCFASPIHYYKTKKFVQRSAEAMEKTSHDSSRDHAPKVSYNSSSSNLLQSRSHDNNPSNTSQEQITSPPSIECWKSEEMNSSEDNKEVFQTIHIKRSQSLGSGLDREAQVSFVVEEDEIDQDLSCDDDSHEKNFKRMFNAFDHNEAVETFDHQDSEVYLLEQFTEPCLVESLQTNDDLVHDKSIFSIGDPQQIEMEVQEEFAKQLSAKHVDDSGYHTPDAPDMIGRIVKSCSLPDLRGSKTSPVEDFPEHGFMGPRSKSFEGLSGIDARKREFLIHEDGSCSRSTIYESKGVPLSRTSPLHGTSSIYQEATHEDCGLSYPSGGSYEVEDEERAHISRSEKHACESQSGDGNSPLHGTCSIYQEATHEDCGLSYPSGGSYEVENEERVHISRSEKHACESHFGDGYDSHNFTGFTTDWALTEMNGVDVGANLQHESSVHRWAGLSNKEFNIKRIEHWINNIDLQNDSPVQEVGECSSSTHNISRDSSLMGGVVFTKSDARLTPGMELANRYISSLTALTTSAQMTNLGLAGVPILSAYVGLRVLNLSGNAIVRITPGALPRGLHVLNLSKNNISTIEGLRELTRLRVLDLSYNRIFRIGHGLASCSSLKELYLAGNKISDVEGLHRLLKLIVLDLRFNKISTAKCLGQLAANYSSLQAINLEGNPAQRNVGDEQLKKYLVGLLPHLVYFNRQTIKNSSLKEVADRPARSVTAYQFDRGLRSENKISRRGSHGASIHRSNHGRSSQAVGSPKLSRARHGGLPSSRSRATHHQLDTGTKRLNLHSRHSIHRSRSEGTLLRFES